MEFVLTVDRTRQVSDLAQAQADELDGLVEKLDYSGEKKVIFREVKLSHPGADRTELGGGIVSRTTATGAENVKQDYQGSKRSAFTSLLGMHKDACTAGNKRTVTETPEQVITKLVKFTKDEGDDIRSKAEVIVERDSRDWKIANAKTINQEAKAKGTQLEREPEAVKARILRKLAASNQ